MKQFRITRLTQFAKDNQKLTAGLIVVAMSIAGFALIRIQDNVEVSKNQEVIRECIENRYEIIGDYNRANELVSSAIRSGAPQSIVDRSYDLLDKIEELYRICKSMVPGWEKV